MSIVERLRGLWTQPLREPAEALAAFAELYTDPVTINGAELPLTALVERADALQRAFMDLSLELIEQLEAPGRLVIVFWQRGRHVGPYASPLGQIEATGRDFQIRVIDVLALADDGRINAIHMVADNLELAIQLGAVRPVERTERP